MVRLPEDAIVAPSVRSTQSFEGRRRVERAAPTLCGTEVVKRSEVLVGLRAAAR
jgi:hypothetical protein